MDGRTQLPVIEWMKRRHGVDYVDSITEPGPVKILAEAGMSSPARSIMGRLAVSVERHGSRVVALVIHHDCTGNPEPKAKQLAQLRKARETVRNWGFDVRLVGLWVDRNWRVHEVK